MHHFITFRITSVKKTQVVLQHIALVCHKQHRIILKWTEFMILTVECDIKTLHSSSELVYGTSRDPPGKLLLTMQNPGQ